MQLVKNVVYGRSRVNDSTFGARHHALHRAGRA